MGLFLAGFMLAVSLVGILQMIIGAASSDEAVASFGALFLFIALVGWVLWAVFFCHISYVG